jgi:preprotein translocase subunit SecG
MGFYTVLLVIHSIIVLFLILMVLIQRTDSDGMGVLGGGGNQFLSGQATANLMTRTTAILAAAFMISSLALAIMAGRMTEGSIIDSVQPAESAPVSDVKDKAPEKKPELVKDKAPDTSKKPAVTAPVVPKPE